MYCHAACWFLLPEATHRAMEPLTPGAPAVPGGVGCTATLPEIFDFEESLAAAYAYVQLIMKAAEPSENALRASSSIDSIEFGLVRPWSRVCFIHSSALRPPPWSKATDLKSSERNLPPNAPSSWV